MRETDPTHALVADALLSAEKDVARAYAEHYRLSHDGVSKILAALDANFLAMLETPQGVTVVGDYIAQCLGCDDSPYMATVH